MFKIVGAVFLFSVTNCFLNRASYGDICGDSIHCDARASLICINNTCGCIKPAEMVYDKERTKCVVLSGERCSYTAVQLGQDTKWAEKLDCINNSKCNDDGYCKCNPDRFENFERFCASKKGFGENCEINEQCQAKMLCDNGTCVCQEGVGHVHDVTKGGCALPEGQLCRNGQDYFISGSCVSNSACMPPYTGYHTRPGFCRCNLGFHRSLNGLCQPIYNAACNMSNPCINNLVCNSGKCDCHHPLIQTYNQTTLMCDCTNGFKLGKSGECLAKHNQTCSYSFDCADDLVCVERKCNCPFPTFQNYTNTTAIGWGCVGGVGSPCNLLIDGKVKAYPCTENARCKNSSGVSECVCNAGFIEGEGKRCEVAYGQSCSATVKCDEIGGLVCKNEVCGCPYLQDYDEKGGKCRGLVGAMCHPSEDFCIEGAICDEVKHRSNVGGNSSLSGGVCSCFRPEELSPERKCIPMKTTTLKAFMAKVVLLEGIGKKPGEIVHDSHGIV